MRISTAVIPVAGRGTRFLPATKEVPKELLPILTRPMIDYVVDEAILAGIKRIIFITSQGKHQIEDFYDTNSSLEYFLQKNGKEEALQLVKDIAQKIEFTSVRQQSPLGLGHAILCAQELLPKEPFLVLLPDDLIDAQTSVSKQLIENFDSNTMEILMGVMEVPREETSKYGIISGEITQSNKKLIHMQNMVEKPNPRHAPSCWATPGRYIFTPDIFHHLKNITRGSGGEFQLTDAIDASCTQKPEKNFAYLFEGTRFDTGQVSGHLKATLHFALKNEELKKIIIHFVEKNLHTNLK